MRVRVVAIAVGPSGIVVPIVNVLIYGVRQISFYVVDESVLPLVNENAARGVKRRHNHRTETNAGGSHEVANQAGKVMKFFAALGLDLRERASYSVRPDCYLNGGLLRSFRGSRSHFFFDPLGQS